MTTATQQLRSRVLGNPNVSIGTAAMLVKLIDIVDKQQGEIDELRQVLLGHERRIADANRNISRLSGVHGA